MIEALLLAFALAMDAFAVALTQGALAQSHVFLDLAFDVPGLDQAIDS
jgi:putative Mn2+ efflux pump MntP